MEDALALVRDALVVDESALRLRERASLAKKHEVSPIEDALPLVECACLVSGNAVALVEDGFGVNEYALLGFNDGFSPAGVGISSMRVALAPHQAAVIVVRAG